MTTPTVAFTTNSAAVTEGNSGTSTLNLTLQLSQASDTTVTASYATVQVAGGATPGNDYLSAAASVTFSPGETSKSISLTVIGDSIYEPNEHFGVQITGATGAIFSPTVDSTTGYSSRVDINIANDDPIPSSSIRSVTVVQGNELRLELFAQQPLTAADMSLAFQYGGAGVTYSGIRLSDSGTSSVTSATPGSEGVAAHNAVGAYMDNPVATLVFNGVGRGTFSVTFASLSVKGFDNSALDGGQSVTVQPVDYDFTTIDASTISLYGTTGNDLIRGVSSAVPAVQSAIYRGASGQYHVSQSNGVVVVTDTVSGRDGSDTLMNVAQAKFTDGALVFDLHSNQDLLVYELYQAAFGRTPDNAGFRYWAGLADANKTSTVSLADSFLGSAEAKQVYGANPSDAAFVTALYSHVLGRTPDADGLAYWIGQANGGVAHDQLLVSFATSAENVQLIGSHIAAGYWTTG